MKYAYLAKAGGTARLLVALQALGHALKGLPEGAGDLVSRL